MKGFMISTATPNDLLKCSNCGKEFPKGQLKPVGGVLVAGKTFCSPGCLAEWQDKTPLGTPHNIPVLHGIIARQ